MEEKTFHKTIFKNTSIFGFSQVIKMLARIVTNKAAAILIGPVGIGIIGLLENIIGLIQSFTNFGLATSSVREVALIDTNTENNTKESRLIKIIYHWAIVTGILGTIVSIVFSKYISIEVFNNLDNIVLILLLSLYFLFSAISSIRLAVLQAKKRVKTIVKFHVVSAIITSIFSVILYYFYGKQGIIPVFLATSFIQLLYSIYLTRNIKVTPKKINFKQMYIEGKPMLKIGLLLSVSVIFGQICFYIIRWFLKEYYSFTTLGIYQVSNTFLVGYLGLVFAAMANDFYPRLCNYENDSKNFNKLINQQTEIALLIIVPAIMVLYLIAPWLIELLYTKEFLEVLPILKIGLFAVILKAIVWPIGFIPLVKGDKKLFIIQNILGDSINVIASIVLFYKYGYIGLGCAMVFMFIVSGIYNYYVAVKYYNFKYNFTTLRIIYFSLFVGLLAMFAIICKGFSVLNYFIILLIIITIFYSVKRLKEKLL